MDRGAFFLLVQTPTTLTQSITITRPPSTTKAVFIAREQRPSVQTRYYEQVAIGQRL